MHLFTCLFEGIQEILMFKFSSTLIQPSSQYKILSIHLTYDIPHKSYFSILISYPNTTYKTIHQDKKNNKKQLFFYYLQPPFKEQQQKTELLLRRQKIPRCKRQVTPISLIYVKISHRGGGRGKVAGHYRKRTNLSQILQHCAKRHDLKTQKRKRKIENKKSPPRVLVTQGVGGGQAIFLNVLAGPCVKRDRQGLVMS